MDNPSARMNNFALFHAVLHLITSCTELVAREIDNAQLSSGKFSRADRDKLKRIAQGLEMLGLLARLIGLNLHLQEQRPIRGRRSVNIGSGTEKGLSITRDAEHAIAPKPDGGALV